MRRRHRHAPARTGLVDRCACGALRVTGDTKWIRRHPLWLERILVRFEHLSTDERAWVLNQRD